MERGYIKIWRKTIESPIFKNPEYFKFWLWCLMKATHKKHSVLVGLQEVNLNPGQFVFGRKKAALETDLSERRVRTFIKNLKKSKNLTIKVTNKFSIITIMNWPTYQQEKIKSDQQSDQVVTSNRPASDQQVTTYKNGKNVKNGKNKRINNKKKIFIPPLLDDVKKFFHEKMYREDIAIKAFDYYENQEPPWTDTNGKQVKSWKSKMIAVWFKDENKREETPEEYAKRRGLN